MIRCRLLLSGAAALITLGALLAGCVRPPLTEAEVAARYQAWVGRPLAALNAAWLVPRVRRDRSEPGAYRYRVDYEPGPGVPREGNAYCDVTVAVDEAGIVRRVSPRGEMCRLPPGLHDFPPPLD